MDSDGESLSPRPFSLRRANDLFRILARTSVANHCYVDSTDPQFCTARHGVEAEYLMENDGIGGELVEDLETFLDRRGSDPIRMFSIGPRDELERVQAAFRDAVPEEATCVFSERDMLEFRGAGAEGKVFGILCEAIDVPIESVMAFGDNLNDLEMIEAAGYGVALALPPVQMRERADTVTANLEGFLHDRYAEGIAMGASQ